MTTTATDLPELEARRLRVIDDSGWAAPVVLFQPRNAMFWVYWCLVIAGLWRLLHYIRVSSAAYGGAIGFGAFWLALYGALFWWATRTMDRYSRLPIPLIVLAFVWGGTAATIFMASAANTPILDLYAKTFGQVWVADWGAGLTAPFVEETANGIGLVVLLVLAPRTVRTAYDGFILGAFLGLGFQLVEDVTYVIASAGSLFGADPIGASLFTLILRILTGAAGHIAYSAIFATGLMFCIGSPALRRRPLLGAGLIVLAMALHGVWDDLGGISGGNGLLVITLELAMIAVSFIAVIRVFNIAVQGERADMAAILAPDVASGTIPADLAVALAGDRHARRTYLRAGTPHRRTRHHILDAGRDYANAIGSSRATIDEHTAHTGAELHRILEQH